MFIFHYIKSVKYEFYVLEEDDRPVNNAGPWIIERRPMHESFVSLQEQC